MKKTFAIFGLIAGLTTAGATQASVGVTGEFGTTGAGAHASVPLGPNLNARVGVNFLGYSNRGSTADLDYNFKLQSNTYDALLDWYPIRYSPFRLTAGAAYNGNRIDVRAKSNYPGSYTIFGRTYNASNAGKVEGSVGFRKTAPYLGIGWGNAVSKGKGWSFSADLGVLFHGSPNVSLTNSGCTAPAPMCAQFAADVAREKVVLTEEVNRFKVYPVLRFGLSYKF